MNTLRINNILCQVERGKTCILDEIIADNNHTKEYQVNVNQIPDEYYEVKNILLHDSDFELKDNYLLNCSDDFLDEQQSSQMNSSVQFSPAIIKKLKVGLNTRNAPKNFMKAILVFIQKNKKQLEQYIQALGIKASEFYSQVSIRKKLNRLSEVKVIWINKKYAKCMRILTEYFLRKHGLAYIFNSRIIQIESHLNYLAALRTSLRYSYTNLFFHHI